MRARYAVPSDVSPETVRAEPMMGGRSSYADGMRGFHVPIVPDTPRLKPRYDQRLNNRGQWPLVALIPPDRPVKITQSVAPLDARAVAGADAVLVFVAREAIEGALAALPFPALWRRLHRTARDRADATVLASRVPNERLAFVAIGALDAGASAYERLALAGRLWKEIAAARPARVVLATQGLPDAARNASLDALLAAVLAGDAPMPDFRSQPAPPPSVTAIRILGARDAVSVPAARAVDAGNHLARWLTTLPPNHLGSLSYRGALEQLAGREGWSYEFLDRRALEKRSAGAFLAVARSNAHDEAGIVRLRYRPAGAPRKAQLALVGKGICFDTGGINLKSHKSMFQMHEDMQGSAVAVGTLLALARNGFDASVDCWLALTENEIGPRAYRPQEIVTAANGTTIQVVHSDAEGRMALADTLALATRERPALVIDFATLTGACVTALTERYSGLFTNRIEWLPWLQEAGRTSGERVWGFPLDADFDGDLTSTIADVLQCAVEGRGDHILAARFLSKFVAAGVPWVHLDLAASHRKGGLAHVPTDVTGFGVRYSFELRHSPRCAELLAGRSQ
jgi:leucyl aminopeptidase